MTIVVKESWMAKKKFLQKIRSIIYTADTAFHYLFNRNLIAMLIIALETLAFLEVNKAAIAKYG